VRYADAILRRWRLAERSLCWHADHAYDQHPLHERVHGIVVRGWSEIRVMGIDPDGGERARDLRREDCTGGAGFSAWVADVMLADVDGMLGGGRGDWGK